MTPSLPSGENATDKTLSLWPIKTFMRDDQSVSSPLTASVSENCGRKCFESLDFDGENGIADKYIWGALSEIGWWKFVTNLFASAANAESSLSKA